MITMKMHMDILKDVWLKKLCLLVHLTTVHYAVQSRHL